MHGREIYRTISNSTTVNIGFCRRKRERKDRTCFSLSEAITQTYLLLRTPSAAPYRSLLVLKTTSALRHNLQRCEFFGSFLSTSRRRLQLHQFHFRKRAETTRMNFLIMELCNVGPSKFANFYEIHITFDCSRFAHKKLNVVHLAKTKKN